MTLLVLQSAWTPPYIRRAWDRNESLKAFCSPPAVNLPEILDDLSDCANLIY